MVKEELLEAVSLFGIYATQWALPEIAKTNEMAQDMIHAYNHALSGYADLRNMINPDTKMEVYTDEDLGIEITILNLGMTTIQKTGGDGSNWFILTSDRKVIMEDKDAPIEIVKEYSTVEIGLPPRPVTYILYLLDLYDVHFTKTKSKTTNNAN